MKNLINHTCTILILFISSFISNMVIAQESVKLTDMYEDYNNYVLRQFVIEYDSVSVSDLKSSVELWAARVMNNAEHVKIAEGEAFVTYKPLLTGNFDGGFGTTIEHKIEVKTLFEFKDGKMRVTLTELPATYVTTSGVMNQRTDFVFYNMKYELQGEVVNKGMYKSTYRRAVKALELIENYVYNIKSIEITTQSDEW